MLNIDILANSNPDTIFIENNVHNTVDRHSKGYLYPVLTAPLVGKGRRILFVPKITLSLREISSQIAVNI